MNLNEMEIPCDPILDKAKRDELVQNTELLSRSRGSLDEIISLRNR